MVNGNFAGGFARGLRGGFQMVSQVRQQREERERRREEMELRRQEMGRGLAADRAKQGQALIENLGGQISQARQEMMSQGGGGGGIMPTDVELPPELQNLVQQATQRYAADLFQAGLASNPRQAMEIAQLTMRSAIEGPAIEAQQAAQRAGMITAAQEAEQITTARPGATVMRGAEQVAQIPAAADQGPLVNFVDPNTGAFVGTVRRDSPEATSLAQQGMIATTAQISGGKEDVTGLPLTARQRGTAATRAVTAASDLARTSRVLKNINEAGPGVVGFRAIVGDKVGGVLGQISSDLGEAATEAVTGVSQERLGNLRAEAQAVAVSLIEPFTGEGSGRISENERRIAENVSRVVNDPTSSFPQVQGALQQAMELQMLVLDREAFAAGEKGIPLTSDEEINSFGEQLEKQGFERDFIIRVILALQEQRQIMGFVQGE
jgi:hypothetical protein